MNSEMFNAFHETLVDIHKNYDLAISVFDRNVGQFVNKTAKPYRIPFSSEAVSDIIENDFIQIVSDTEKIFTNTREINIYREDFHIFYNEMEKVLSVENPTDKDKTMIIFLVLIMLGHNSIVNTQKLNIIIQSMCSKPDLNSLVSVTSSVMNTEYDF